MKPTGRSRNGRDIPQFRNSIILASNLLDVAAEEIGDSLDWLAGGQKLVEIDQIPLITRNHLADVLSALVASIAHKVLTFARHQERHLHILVALRTLRCLDLKTGSCFIQHHGYTH
jgi:hypothetical protein